MSQTRTITRSFLILVISPLAKMCVWSISLLLIQISLFGVFVKMFVTIRRCVMKMDHKPDCIFTELSPPDLFLILGDNFANTTNN